MNFKGEKGNKGFYKPEKTSGKTTSKNLGKRVKKDKRNNQFKQYKVTDKN